MDSFPRGQRPQIQLPGRWLVTGATIIVVVLITLGAVDFITEWLWFDALGFTSVFITSILARLALFVAGALLFLALFAVNVITARGLVAVSNIRPQQPAANAPWEDLLRQIGAQVPRSGGYAGLINGGLVVGGLFLAFFMGLLATGNWLPVLQFLNRSSFGIADPAFGQDVGFYFFVMPTARATEGWLFTAWVLVVLSVILVHLVALTLDQGLHIGSAGISRSRGLIRHLLCLAAVFFLLMAAHHVLDTFDLVRSTRGAAYGAGFTDINAQQPAQLVLAALALLASVLFIASAVRGGPRLAIAGAGVWAVALVLIGVLVPIAVQQVAVSPNELDRERPYIERTIESTRHAFGLDTIEQRDVTFQDAVTPEALAADPGTVNNIRLWDPRPLLDTYKQIQTIRQYYQFDDVDVDRYTINGDYLQVMISARELVPEQLPQQAQSWVSQQLQYTHGYGVVMSPVNQVSQEGLPDLFIQDIPPIGQIAIPRPEIYFGQKTNHYVITRTATPEFDYPSGDQGAFVARYQADSGVSVGSFARRLLFALKFQDPNFLLNSSLGADSELLYRRNIGDRAQQLAPFLGFDPDPYIVVADGALYWVQDAYTTSDRYPYAEPYQPPTSQGERRPRPFNYMRNSVKVVTNAYDGTVHFYVTDPADPLVQTYARIFPALFQPQSDAPAAIRAHFRYPEGLFRVQATKYQLFHIQDPRVFYLREDQWTIPNELFTGTKQPVEPYYVIMRPPGDDRAEFMLMLPFTPSNRDNMIGWLAARSDIPDYGKMLVYNYPKDTVIYGPFQIETRIDQDATISAQFSLWNQSGSKVIRGNLLAIPIGQSNLYVEPIYLQATASPLPELKRVVVANGNQIVMEATLADALNRLFGASAPAAAPGAAPSPQPSVLQPVRTEIGQLADRAQAQYQGAQEALRVSDFTAYGEEIRGLGETLKQLQQAVTSSP